jgi:hypothetical protein
MRAKRRIERGTSLDHLRAADNSAGNKALDLRLIKCLPADFEFAS